MRVQKIQRAWTVLACAALSVAAQPAYCWDKFGHEVITQIAYDHLKPGVKAQADSLIAAMASDPEVTGLDSQYKPYNFVTAGAWMDDIKSISKEFSTWHYIDLPIDNAALTSADVASFTDTNPSNAVHAIETFCMPNLQNTSAPVADRARALGFFLHLAGDLHQPLHAVGIDRGGNAYVIDPVPSADPDWPVKNLHAFWDGAYRYGVKDGAITVTEAGLDIPRISAPGQDPIASFANEIEKEYAPSDKKLIDDDNCADWALESKDIAASFVYPAMNNQHTLTPDYVQKAHDIACQRLVLAGLREAYTLNKWLGSSSGVSLSTTPTVSSVSTDAATSIPDQSDVALKDAPATISATSPDVLSALKPADVTKATGMVGQDASLHGTVAQVYSPSSHAMVVLDFDTDYEGTITAIARPDSYAKLPDLKSLQGKQLLISGRITSYHGRIEIVLTDASQIQIVQ